MDEFRRVVEDKIVEWHVSLWFAAAVLILSATMMHPSFASIFVILVDVGLLVGMRAAAHVEGRSL